MRVLTISGVHKLLLCTLALSVFAHRVLLSLRVCERLTRGKLLAILYNICNYFTFSGT